jgi:hypothetical protein
LLYFIWYFYLIKYLLFFLIYFFLFDPSYDPIKTSSHPVLEPFSWTNFIHVQSYLAFYENSYLRLFYDYLPKFLEIVYHEFHLARNKFGYQIFCQLVFQSRLLNCDYISFLGLAYCQKSIPNLVMIFWSQDWLFIHYIFY